MSSEKLGIWFVTPSGVRWCGFGIDRSMEPVLKHIAAILVRQRSYSYKDSLAYCHIHKSGLLVHDTVNLGPPFPLQP